MLQVNLFVRLGLVLCGLAVAVSGGNPPPSACTSPYVYCSQTNSCTTLTKCYPPISGGGGGGGGGFGGGGGSGDPGCFASDSMVRVLSPSCTDISNHACISSRTISSLRLGDLVESVESTGTRSFEPVIDLSHDEKDSSEVTLRRLHVLHSQETLTLTDNHLVYVRGRSPLDSEVNSHLELSFQGGRLISASQVRVGDLISVLSPASNTSVWLPVAEISTKLVVGVRNVWTRSARLVVDGVVASPFRVETYHTYRNIQHAVQAILGRGVFKVAEQAKFRSDQNPLTLLPASPSWMHNFVHVVYMSAIELYYSSYFSLIVICTTAILAPVASVVVRGRMNFIKTPKPSIQP